MKSIVFSVICMLLVLQLSLVVRAEQQISSNVENEKSTNLEEKNEQYELMRRKLYKTLLELVNDEQTNESNEDDSQNEDYLAGSDSPLDKRMTYRYGKRMTYRYGKRSAMPYRFGKRSQPVSALNAQDLIEILKAADSEDRVNKRMTYRYGRSLDKRSAN